MAEGPLLGRSEELARIEAFVEAVARGPASLTLIGEAGIGKSAIWTEVLARARTRGDRTVLAARAVEAERDLVDVVLADLLGPVATDLLPTLPPPQADGLGAALLLERPTTPIDPRLVGTATLSVLERLATERPLLIAIDDVQWVDGASADALGFALRRAWARDLPVALLATLRGGSGARPPAWLGPTEVLEVGPVSLGVLHHLIRERIDTTLTRPQLVRLESESLGNPLLALELARAIERRGRWPLPGEPLPVPDDIERLVDERLSTLPTDDRQVLFVASVVADPTAGSIAKTIGRPVDDVEAALDRATEADLLEGPPAGDPRRDIIRRFAHPLYAAAASTAIPPIDRRALHARLAELATDDETRGRHAALASEGPDAETAALIEAAAAAARRRGAPSVAADMAETAAARTPPDDRDEATRRRVLATRWLGEAGVVERARALLAETMAVMPPGDARAEAGELAAQMAGWVEGPRELLRLATAALDDARDPFIRSRLLLRIAGEGDVIGGLSALGHVEEAIDLLRGADAAARDPDLLACAYLQSASIRYQLGSADDEAMVADARALLADEPRTSDDGVDRPEGHRAHQLAWVWSVDHDRLDEAIPGVLADVERTIRSGHDRPLAIDQAEASILYVWAGQLDAADDHARAATEAADLADHPQARSAALSAVAGVALLRGHLDAAEAATRDGLAIFPEEGFLRDRHLATLGGVALVRGEAASAAAILGSLFDEQLRRDGRESLQNRIGADLVEAAVSAGDLVRAEAVVALQEQSAATMPRPWIRVVAPRGRALLDAARGDLEAADAAAGAALDAATGLGMPVEHARTELIAGRIARRRKDRRRAGDLLDAAAATFEQVGAGAWLAIARAEAARLGRRVADDPDALTETEDRVARLAASGRTNREVGEAVFLTPKSVEGVLSRVYQKLGIRSRAELGAWLAASSASSDRESPISSGD